MALKIYTTSAADPRGTATAAAATAGEVATRRTAQPACHGGDEYVNITPIC